MSYDNPTHDTEQEVVDNSHAQDEILAWLSTLDAAKDAGAIQAADHGQLRHLEAECAIGLISNQSAQSQAASLLAGGGAAELALNAIGPLFDAGDVVELSALHASNGGGALSLHVRLDDPEGRKKALAFIRTHIGKRNLYFGANPRREHMDGTVSRAKTEDVAARRSFFFDLDNKDAPASDPEWSNTVKALRDLGPALDLDTGNGRHIWFRMQQSEGISAEATASLRSMMETLGADDMSDAPRIARLPYTVNIPTPSKSRRGATPRFSLPEAQNVKPSARTMGDTQSAIQSIASRLTLPGKGQPKADSGKANSGSASSGSKTGWEAPSLQILELALSELPNNGAFDDRAEWSRIGHAIKGAAVAAGIDAAARDLWLAWCARWPGHSDASADEKFWDTCDQPHTGWGTVMRELERTNLQGHARVKTATAQHAFSQEAAANTAALTSAAFTPVTASTPSQIPPRRFLYGKSVIGDVISIVAAPGGSGKSALTMTEAVAMATGKVLLPGDAPRRPLKVWLHNGEDGADELQRRLAATMMHHKISDADLGGRLYMTNGRDEKILLAQQGKDGPELTPGVAKGIIERIKSKGIDVLILDPLGAFHTLPENSNEAVNILMDGLRKIAHSTGVAIVLVHHVGKLAAKDMDGAGAGAARGASAFVDAARVVRQLSRMSDTEARKLGVPVAEAWQHICVANGKGNLAPLEDRTWFKLIGVQLGNKTPEYPDGDNVQTVERWTPPAPAKATQNDLAIAQHAINGKPELARASHRNNSQPVRGSGASLQRGLHAVLWLRCKSRTAGRGKVARFCGPGNPLCRVSVKMKT